MKMTRIRVKNLRCIDELQIQVRNYTSLIGPNNSGKSCVLRAIELLLNQETPALDEWRKGHEKEAIEIDADFDELEEWERKKPGVSSLVYDGRIRLRLLWTAKTEGTAKPKLESSYEAFKQEETIEGWPDGAKWSELDEEIRTLAEKNQIKGANFKNANQQEHLRDLVREFLPARRKVGEARWTSEGISIKEALQQALPQAQLIPAVRDAEEDGAPGATTSFGVLLKKAILPEVIASVEYKGLMDAVKVVEQRLRAEDEGQLPAVRELSSTISARLSSIIRARVRIGMDPPDAEKFVGSNTVLQLDDGTSTRIALQGHGLQRALVFALLEVIAGRDARLKTEGAEAPRTRSTLLLFEEPELFIHPHLMRKLKEALERISEAKDWQVVISTHSPFLVDVGKDPRSLIVHRRSDPAVPPKVKQLVEDPFADDEEGSHERERLRAVLDFHPTVSEAFFAKHVVLVEGDSELAVLGRQPALYAVAGVSAEAVRDVTVVSCDGKWTIIPVARLLRRFDIPVKVVHDMDRKGKTDEDLAADKAHEFHANVRIADVVDANNVFIVSDTLEDLLWDGVPRPRAKDKPFRAWKRVRELCDGKANLDHAPRLRELVQFAFAPFT